MEEMANSVDADQTDPLWAVWAGSTLFTEACMSEHLEYLGQRAYFLSLTRQVYCKALKFNTVKQKTKVQIIQAKTDKICKMDGNK